MANDWDAVQPQLSQPQSPDEVMIQAVKKSQEQSEREDRAEQARQYNREIEKITWEVANSDVRVQLFGAIAKKAAWVFGGVAIGLGGVFVGRRLLGE